jgi:hypothetical protein
MHNEQQIEAEIQSKGLNAPRLSPAMIDEAIVAEQFYVFPGTNLTVCCLTLRNGFSVTGESSTVSPANFDAAVACKLSRERARSKIWELEGYLLRERLAAAPKPEVKLPDTRKIPTIGRIVVYMLTDQDAEAINRRRTTGQEIATRIASIPREWPLGAQAHIGNHVTQGMSFPMIIVRTWGDTPESAVQGQVLLDGNDTFWATSRVQGEHAGMWQWPARA